MTGGLNLTHIGHRPASVLAAALWKARELKERQSEMTLELLEPSFSVHLKLESLCPFPPHFIFNFCGPMLE
jgi:hypothetical protein